MRIRMTRTAMEIYDINTNILIRDKRRCLNGRMIDPQFLYNICTKVQINHYLTGKRLLRNQVTQISSPKPLFNHVEYSSCFSRDSLQEVLTAQTQDLTGVRISHTLFKPSSSIRQIIEKCEPTGMRFFQKLRVF